MRAEPRDGGAPADGDPRLRPAQQLVPAEGHDVGSSSHRLLHRLLRAQAVGGRLEERPAPEVVDEDDAPLAREPRELARRGARGEPDDAEVAGVHAEDRGGPLTDRGGVVAEIRAVRRPHLDELRPGPREHVRDAEPTADLHELAAGDDDLAAPRERREREEDRRGVVVGDDAVLRAGDLRQDPRGVAVPLAPAARPEVVLDRHRAGGIPHRVPGPVGQRRAPEVRVEDHAGRVDDPTQRPAIALGDPLARPAERLGGRHGQPIAPCRRERVPDRGDEPLAGPRVLLARLSHHGIDRRQLTAGIAPRARTGAHAGAGAARILSAAGLSPIRRWSVRSASPSTCIGTSCSRSISTSRARRPTMVVPFS